MGVPSFYRWLSKKYPKIVVDVVEEKPVELPSGQQAPVNTALPNPNGFEIDNLYLDMNGIIHPCCHPEDGAAPNDESEMIRRIFLYLDRIFGMVRPRQILYMAIDGVAPRAKMNQQRSRRFRSAKEVTDQEIAEDELRKEWEDKGLTPPPRKPRPWDSNVITPGTPFMAKLSRAIHWYIYDRLSHDPGFKGVKIIFSDAKVPGEGEHKIMKFIRLQRAHPGYNPNTRHVLYGMDADLIMLGLATHDPHFLILRETITENNPRGSGPRCFLCGVQGHRADECSGIQEEEKKKAEESGAIAPPVAEPGLMDKPFQFLMLNVLREYLAHDLYVPNLPFAWDLEKCIDDFVFLCFFVGNDFLPHLPALEIREGAIERLVGIYKRLLPSLGGYLSENGGSLNLSRIDVLLSDLGVVEDSIFKSRKSKEDYIRQRDATRSEQLATRRAQTMKAREGQLQFAAEQGFSAVSSGLNLHGKNVQPIIKQQMGISIKQEMKTEIKTADDGKGKKRKKNANETATTNDADSTPSKKTKLLNGSAQASTAAGDEDDTDDVDATIGADDDVDEEMDSEDDPSDPTFRPHDALDSSSCDDSDDDEEDAAKAAAKKAKLKKAQRRAKQAAKKIKSESGVKTEDEPATVVDNLKKDSTGKTQTAMDAKSAELDFGAILNAKLRKMSRPGDDDEEDEEKRDPIRFGEEGWKPRYYSTKMHIQRDSKEDAVIFHKLFKSYAEGLAWVMKYYYEGCASWSWYYPFHYAPMASDLSNLDRYKIEFDLSEPFKPIGQLMGVLPSKSAHALPIVCQELMMNPLSPIIDFYPENFPLDLNGKKALWQAVALLPWIEEKRLLEELRKVEPKFNDEERDRNSLGVDYLFVHKSNLMANSIYALYNAYPPETLVGKTHLQCSQLKQDPIDTAESHGMSGSISPYIPMAELDGTLASEVGAGTIENIQVMSVIFHDPPHRPHICALLPGVVLPAPVLQPGDLEEAARGGYQGRDTNQSRNNQQRYNNQRESNRQPQGVVGGYQSQTHGGQAPSFQPKFGSAPSHFQQGDVSNRIWSSGFNQKEGGGQNQQRGGGNYQQRQQGGGGYQQQQQQQGGGYRHQQRGGYQQQQSQQSYQQQPYQHSQSYQPQNSYHPQRQQSYQQQPQYAPAAPVSYAQQQQAQLLAGPYAQPPTPSYSSYAFPAPPPLPQAYQSQPAYSHARSQPPATSGTFNQLAALQAQIQSSTAQRKQQQQQRR